MSSIAAPALSAHVARETLAAGLLAPGTRVLVAVSAGRDSTALACLLADGREHLPLDLVLGHVDHGWRGRTEATADRAAIVALGQRLAVPVSCAGPPPAGTPHTEDAARRHRYRALGAMARTRGLTTIATAHHAGDQAETVLMRLLRGSGLVGLTGIPPSRSLAPGDLRVVRPLLEVSPETLEEWLSERGITWREDPTNTDLRRDRARIRARLRTRSPAARHDLADVAARLRGRLEARIAQIDRQAADYFEPHPFAHAVAMPRTVLAELHGEDLALALRRAGQSLQADREGPWLTRRHVARIEALVEGRGALDLPRDLRIHAQGKTIWLLRRTAEAMPLPALAVEFIERAAFDIDAWRAAPRTNAAALDGDRLGPSPQLRWLREDDEFAPLGGSGRRVRIHAWLSRQGVPGFVRRAQLVLVGEAGVAWIVGRRVDHGHAVSAATRRVAVVRVS